MATITLIPNPGDIVNATQVPILGNFTSINTAFNLNHGNFGTAAEGKHNFLQMPDQAFASVPTLANEAALFSAQGAISAASELVFRRENSGDEIAFTEFLGADPGWTRLPSGLLVKWGRLTSGGTGLRTATYHTGATIPAFATAVYTVQISQYSTTGTDNNEFTQLVSYGPVLNFQVWSGARITVAAKATSFTYLAIGI